MQITKKFIIVGAGVLTLVAGGGVAYAATSSSAAAPRITAERAMQIAHQRVPGAWVSEVDYDGRGTRADVWEIELTKGSMHHELDVDAATGRILKYETERADRDDHGDDDRRGRGHDDRDDD
ncbi:PepSY domain-containing protein [Nonomuraea purpurea]|uniref:PepSY domain-containing protein n=1 Tax=Nonomuraea purpurea TaxID=1849276 RepID=A0ABV8FVB0_9ACTN